MAYMKSPVLVQGNGIQSLRLAVFLKGTSANRQLELQNHICNTRDWSVSCQASSTTIRISTRLASHDHSGLALQDFSSLFLRRCRLDSVGLHETFVSTSSLGESEASQVGMKSLYKCFKRTSDRSMSSRNASASTPMKKPNTEQALHEFQPLDMAPQSSLPVVANFDSNHLLIGAGVAIFHIATARVVLCYHSVDQYWFLPKGRRDSNEDSGSGAEREGFEEVNIMTSSTVRGGLIAFPVWIPQSSSPHSSVSPPT